MEAQFLEDRFVVVRNFDHTAPYEAYSYGRWLGDFDGYLAAEAALVAYERDPEAYEAQAMQRVMTRAAAYAAVEMEVSA